MRRWFHIRKLTWIDGLAWLAMLAIVAYAVSR